MLKSYFVFEEREHYLEEPHALSPSSYATQTYCN